MKRRFLWVTSKCHEFILIQRFTQEIHLPQRVVGQEPWLPQNHLLMGTCQSLQPKPITACSELFLVISRSVLLWSAAHQSAGVTGTAPHPQSQKRKQKKLDLTRHPPHLCFILEKILHKVINSNLSLGKKCHDANTLYECFILPPARGGTWARLVKILLQDNSNRHPDDCSSRIIYLTYLK